MNIRELNEIYMAQVTLEKQNCIFQVFHSLRKAYPDLKDDQLADRTAQRLALGEYAPVLVSDREYWEVLQAQEAMEKAS